MHPTVATEIRRACSGRTFDAVLEIGATRSSTLLTEAPFASASRRAGVDLEGWSHPDLTVHETNAHDLSMFDDDAFDCVLCNAVLEHDPEFWLTLAEIRRVAAPGATLVLGVPGYSERVERSPLLSTLGLDDLAGGLDAPDVRSGAESGDGSGPAVATDGSGSRLTRWYRALPERLQQIIAEGYRSLDARDGPVAKTYGVHESPGDYYRFSPQAVEEVFLRGCRDCEVVDVLSPPRLIGIGEFVGDE